ncbi:MAG: hypothetical protein KJ006_10295, partial [Thermoleophilia bacterium]|nr:hypothetical protein [Thermoleophilia bacterium]
MARLTVPAKRILALAGLALLFGGAAAAVLAGRGDGDGAEVAPPTTTAPPAPAPAPPPPPAAPEPIAAPLDGLRGYDPEGDGRERD